VGDGGDQGRRAALLEEALALSRELGDRHGIADVLNLLGRTARSRGDHEQAAVLAGEALALYRELGDTWGTLFALGMLGRNALYLQDYPRSEALGRERLTLCRALRDDWAECSTLCTMGHLAWFLGDRRRATALLEESLALARACGHTHVVALALYRLGHVALVRGDVGPAAERFRQGLRVCRELGQVPAGRQSLAWTLEGIAGVAHAHGSPAQAGRLLGAAAALHQATGESLPRTERADGERITAAVRGAMDGQRFAAAWAAGGAIPAEQAVADAQALLERAVAGAAAAPNARPSPRNQADGGVTPRAAP